MSYINSWLKRGGREREIEREGDLVKSFSHTYIFDSMYILERVVLNSDVFRRVKELYYAAGVWKRTCQQHSIKRLFPCTINREDSVKGSCSIFFYFDFLLPYFVFQYCSELHDIALECVLSVRHILFLQNIYVWDNVI